MRKTHSLAQILSALMEDPNGRHWGYKLTKQAGVRSGVLYPILHRMLDQGWLEDGWEETDPGAKRNHPPRRYYKLTPDGKAAVFSLLAEMREDARFGALLGGVAT
jgi:PadR family transcriptional regulator PadR